MDIEVRELAQWRSKGGVGVQAHTLVRRGLEAQFGPGQLAGQYGFDRHLGFQGIGFFHQFPEAFGLMGINPREMWCVAVDQCPDVVGAIIP